MNTVIKIFLVNKSDFLYSSEMTQLVSIETAQHSFLFLAVQDSSIGDLVSHSVTDF